MRDCVYLSLLIAALGCGTKDGGTKSQPQEQPEPRAEKGAAVAENESGTEVLPADAAPQIDRAAYDEALKRGRALEKAGDHAAAQEAFGAALEAKPNDPIAFSERGWAAFRGGNLVTAREATKASIGNAVEPKVKAASLYNLGRILERFDDWQAAREAYAESLRLRPHKVVEKRKAFVEQRLAAPDDLRPVLLAGPLESLDQVCTTLTTSDGHGKECGHGKSPAATGHGSIRAVWLFDNTTMDETRYYLALATEAGFFYSEPISRPPDTHSNSFALAVADFPAAGKGAVLRVATRTRETWPEDGGGWAEELWEAAVFCGVGLSKIPSCTQLIVGVDAPDQEGETFKAPLTAELLDGNRLRIIAQGKPADELRALVGTHTLTFP